VVVTGGEPAIHDLRPLVDALHAAGLPVHLETSGAFVVRGDFDWITLSPKRWKLPLEANLACADEFKIIVDAPSAIGEYSARLSVTDGPVRPIWLHPEWSQRGNAAVLNVITDWVKAHGAPYRAGWQLHKPYQADRLDPKSAQAAPLGGDPAQGW